MNFDTHGRWTARQSLAAVAYQAEPGTQTSTYSSIAACGLALAWHHSSAKPQAAECSIRHRGWPIVINRFFRRERSLVPRQRHERKIQAIHVILQIKDLREPGPRKLLFAPVSV